MKIIRPTRPNIVLTLILAELRASIRNARRRDLAWVFLGGGSLLAYALGIVFLRIQARADIIRDMDWIWWAALPGMMLVAGALTGLGVARIAQARAYAPFMKAQPLGDDQRRETASSAAIILGIPMLALDGFLVFGGALAAGQDWPVAWGVGAIAVSILGLVMAVRLRLRAPYNPRETGIAGPKSYTDGISLGWIDRSKPAWIGSWANGMEAGRFRPSLRAALILLGLVGAGIIAATGSIVRDDASPATIMGVIGGLAIFMMALSCRPLLSPVLRASSLGFTRAVRGLARLPLLLSLLFFGAMAAPAYAAEPGTMLMPLSGAATLLSLNAIYTAFAAFFAFSRRLAVFAFFAALGLTAYETLEYGRTVLLGLTALVVFLWIKARSKYRHG